MTTGWSAIVCLRQYNINAEIKFPVRTAAFDVRRGVAAAAAATKARVYSTRRKPGRTVGEGEGKLAGFIYYYYW